MSFMLTAVAEADLPDLASLSFAAWDYRPWTLLAYIFSNVTPEDMYAYRLARLRIDMKQTGVLHFKVVDLSKNLVVSYASWGLPKPLDPHQAPSTAEPAAESPELICPDGCNWPMLEDFYGERDRIANVLVDKTSDYGGQTMNSLVLPLDAYKSFSPTRTDDAPRVSRPGPRLDAPPPNVGQNRRRGSAMLPRSHASRLPFLPQAWLEGCR